MNDAIIVQYVGFHSREFAREYTFTVRETACEPREFTLTIANEAFRSQQVQYQDAPAICSERLHRELAASANHPAATQFLITDAELADFHRSHRSKPSWGGPTAHRKE